MTWKKCTQNRVETLESRLPGVFELRRKACPLFLASSWRPWVWPAPWREKASRLDSRLAVAFDPMLASLFGAHGTRAAPSIGKIMMWKKWCIQHQHSRFEIVGKKCIQERRERSTRWLSPCTLIPNLISEFKIQNWCKVNFGTIHVKNWANSG